MSNIFILKLFKIYLDIKKAIKIFNEINFDIINYKNVNYNNKLGDKNFSFTQVKTFNTNSILKKKKKKFQKKKKIF